MNNTHEYYEMLISRYKDNDLNDEEILEMEKHLDECPECRKFKEEIFAMSSILTGKMPIKVNNTKKTLNRKKHKADLGLFWRILQYLLTICKIQYIIKYV